MSDRKFMMAATASDRLAYFQRLFCSVQRLLLHRITVQELSVMFQMCFYISSTIKISTFNLTSSYISYCVPVGLKHFNKK